MSVTAHSREYLESLARGNLEWTRAREMMTASKDPDRFERMIEIESERVPWDDRILLPYGEHLYIVEQGPNRLVKCSCGHEFGDYRKNWKFSALINVRDDEESLEELYAGPRKPDPNVCEIREYICPGCGTLLEVEALPPGYPPVFNFLPDLDGFYSKWLGKSLNNSVECEDLSGEITAQWEKELLAKTIL